MTFKWDDVDKLMDTFLDTVKTSFEEAVKHAEDSLKETEEPQQERAKPPNYNDILRGREPAQERTIVGNLAANHLGMYIVVHQTNSGETPVGWISEIHHAQPYTSTRLSLTDVSLETPREVSWEIPHGVTVSLYATDGK